MAMGVGEAEASKALSLKSKRRSYWMCEVCEQAPTAVTCKVDIVALCVTCNFDIHSTNPLAQRHERVLVEPFYDSTETIMKAFVDATFNFLIPSDGFNQDNADAVLWLIPNPTFNSKLMHALEIKPI